jgi:hypothetical protein
MQNTSETHAANRTQCYETFYDRNLQIFVISLSVCPRQAFMA